MEIGGAMVQEEKVIEVKNLKKYYGDVKAVDDISFYVQKGQVFTLLGPNGAGKTTTLEILEGLKVLDSGEMNILGERCHQVSRRIKERIGVLLQETVFVNRLRVREIVQLFSSFFSQALPVAHILEIVSLEDKAEAFVENLSGGQRQRLAIGIALINDPEIIFMDEPTTGLDPQARRNIWSLMERLREEKKTIFLTTHYMEEAERLSDYVYIMDHGQIIAFGTPRDLIRRYSKESIIEIQQEGLDDEDILQMKQKFGEIGTKDETLFIYTEDLTSSLSNLLTWEGSKGSHLFHNLTFRQPNLEDVFLSLTGKGLRD